MAVLTGDAGLVGKELGQQEVSLRVIGILTQCLLLGYVEPLHLVPFRALAKIGMAIKELGNIGLRGHGFFFGRWFRLVLAGSECEQEHGG